MRSIEGSGSGKRTGTARSIRQHVADEIRTFMDGTFTVNLEDYEVAGGGLAKGEIRVRDKTYRADILLQMQYRALLEMIK